MKMFSGAARAGAAAGLAVALLFSAACAKPFVVKGQPFVAIDAFAQKDEMARGVNVLGYDPVWQDRSKGRFTPAMFKKIREAGFSNVRLVMQTFAHLDANNQLDPKWLATLDQMVRAALEQGLTVVLDEHDYNICAQSADNCRTKLTALWSQLAPHFADAPNKVVFELLNEPNTAITPQVWHSLYRELLAVVRQTNPTRNVVIGGPNWNNLEGLPWVKLPDGDQHIIVALHYYLPRPFTHQGAAWDPVNTDLGVTWGTKSEYQAMEEELYVAKMWSDANNRPIYLGEFGAYDKAPMESRAKWTAAVARYAERYGFAWAYWQLDPDFALYDFKTGTWVEPLLNALVPNPAPSAQ
ncbi:MAG TPA: glycoside hydrolase family 5 protein [Rhizomicrobium sp.]|nr:glycoside hydrolase family 5 protein [Rhizomicrobium sp.]